MHKQAIGLVLVGASILAFGCSSPAPDGCDNAKGKYLFSTSLDPSQPRSCSAVASRVLNVDVGRFGADPGCELNAKTSSGKETCRIETDQTCKGSSGTYTTSGVFTYVADGASGTGTATIAFSDGTTCTYSLSAKRL